MKPTLPVSLLLFLQLATSAPIPASFPPDCAYTPCHPSLLRLLSSGAKPNTPPTKLSNPHFPPHQQAYPSADEEAFDNSPITPSSQVPPAIALSFNRPLESAYLRSLSNPASTPTLQHAPLEEDAHDSTVELASKPTSALPNLRREDAERYWASKGNQVHDGSTVASDGPSSSEERENCGGNMLLPGNVYIKSHNMSRGSDIMVVGIVLLFLAIVIAVEGAEKIREWYDLPYFPPSPFLPIYLNSS
jgi:hypothetical protein